MPEPAYASQVVCFGTFELDLRSGELRKSGLRIKIQEQPFQVLAMLLEHPGEMVTREELRKKLWPEDTFVDFEHGLNAAINKLREALGDSADNPRFVETLPRRGYRFIAPLIGAGLVPAPEGRPRGVPLRKRWPLLLTGLLAVVVVGLSIAWFVTHRPPPPAPPLKERRLTAYPSENAVNAGAVSPNGKYVAYSDTTGIHLKLIQTGETVNIPRPQGPAPDPGNWWPAGWFPDSTKFVAAGAEPGLPVSAWVISVLGGPPRKLRDDADPWTVSPDGRLIAFGTGDAFIRHREIWVMGAQGEEARRFVSGSENDGFFWAAWSPGGQRIAYFRFHRTPEKLECTIESRDLKGSDPIAVLSDPNLCNGNGLGTIWWGSGGRFIYTMPEPSPKPRLSLPGNNLWEIMVDTRTGHVMSTPRRITNWVGVVQAILGGTEDGKYLAGPRWSIEADVYVGDLEANGRRLKNVRRLTLDENDDLPGGWMPDSKAVLFASDRNGTWDVFKQALDQAEAQLVVTGPDFKWQPVLSPDGSWILNLSSATGQLLPTTAVSIMRVSTSGGPPQLVLEGRGIERLACSRSPATLCVLTERTPDERQLIFSALDPVNGRGNELTRINLRNPGDSYGWDLSRDGSRLAFTEYDEHEGRIQILALTKGKAQEVNVKGWSRFSDLYWAADGEGLYVSRLPTSGTMLLYVDLEGRANVLWEHRFAGAWETWGVPSPDGRHLALAGHSVSGNVWMLENF